MSQRGVILVTVMLFGALALVAWLAMSKPSQPAQQGILAIAAVSAVFAAISAFGSLLQAVEVQRQRRLQERPYVAAYFDGDSNGFVSLVFENVGNSPATNVRLSFDPDPVDFRGRPLSQVSLFAYPVTFLPQGKRFRQLIDAGSRFLAEGTPTAFSITTRYESSDGQQFQETRHHDIAYMRQAINPPKTTEDWLKVVAENLKRLADTQQANAQHL
jgi:hypothetical protein